MTNQGHAVYSEIVSGLIENAKTALAVANMHAAFFDPGLEHRGNLSILSAAHAGELFIKAIIAQEHPLLIFKNIFEFDDKSSDEIDIDLLIRKAKTHDFHNLPKVLWSTKKERLPNPENFEQVRLARNAVQHFFHPDGLEDLGFPMKNLSLEFIYKNIDPIIHQNFGLFAIDFHEDTSVGYDYLVSCVAGSHLRFSVPDDFDLTEISLSAVTAEAPSEYKDWLRGELQRIEREDLLQ